MQDKRAKFEKFQTHHVQNFFANQSHVVLPFQENFSHGLRAILRGYNQNTQEGSKVKQERKKISPWPSVLSCYFHKTKVREPFRSGVVMCFYIFTSWPRSGFFMAFFFFFPVCYWSVLGDLCPDVRRCLFQYLYLSSAASPLTMRYFCPTRLLQRSRTGRVFGRGNPLIGSKASISNPPCWGHHCKTIFHQVLYHTR